MKTKQLGSQGFQIQLIGLGCMGMSPSINVNTYGYANENESIATIHRSLELGGNFLDTSDLYGPLHNEKLIGKAIQGNRDKYSIATKFGFEIDDNDQVTWRINGKRDYVKKAAERSLKNLGTDYIDLLYAHRLDPETPIEETIGAMAELVQEGKVGYIGISEATEEQIRKAHVVFPLTAVQNEYSLFTRAAETDGVYATTHELGIGLVAYSPLGRGFLTGQIKSPDDFAPDDCILRYGPQHYDFKEGVLSFIKPGQVMRVEQESENVPQGFMLTFHPDFMQSFALAMKIRKYDFFDYSASEALFLSEKEKTHIRAIMGDIEREYHTNIDAFSQEAIVTYIDLLLVYGNRYYNRQFITRKPKNDQLYMQFENLLHAYFAADKALHHGLPTVQYFADHLHISANYLSDMLRISTKQSAQNHIQNKVIEMAKALLSTSNLSVAEIAYQLGFERPQSLNRLFKKKTNVSPLEYRESFN